MKKQNMNNLLTCCKRVLLAVTLMIALNQNAKADNQSAPLTQNKTENNSDSNGKVAAEILLLFGAIAGGLWLFGKNEGADFAGKLNWDRKQQQQR